MKFSIKSLIPLCLAAFTTPFNFAAENVNNGTITLIYDKDEGECTMPVADKYQLEIYHADEAPPKLCEGHSVRYVRFNNVRSAVTISLSSHFDRWNHAIGCSFMESPNPRPNNFQFELRTIKNYQSSQPIALDDISNSDVGKPFIPGVLVKSRVVHNPDEINRELSCVQIKID